MDVEEFIKRSIRHIPERQFKMVRYYGYDPLKCGSKMRLNDIIYPRIGSVMKLYEALELRKVEEELQDLKSQYNSVKRYINNPLFVGGRG